MIHLVQYLCPDRHCILAVPYDPTETTYNEVLKFIAEKIAQKHINPWCGICGTTDLRFEDSPTGFHTLDEACPKLREEELKQIITGIYASKQPKPN